MSYRTPVHAITHVHTEASNGRNSDMDAMITGAIRAALGPETRVVWRECFTPVSRLARLLDDRTARPRIRLLTITDHLTAAQHRLPDDALRAAAEDPRIAVCGEVWCEEQDADGEFQKAPEVLVYGSPTPVDGPFGPHFGVSQELLDEIFRSCCAPGRTNPQTTRVLAFCADRGLACALAHPFDGHALSLEATFDVISRGRFVETVNGGFSARSTRILEDLIAFQNRIVEGARLSAAAALRYPAARRLQERIVEENRSLLHPWGGSDAHSHAFARVTMRFLSDRPSPNAGDLFAALLDRRLRSLLLDGTFRIRGRAGTKLSVTDDIVRIVIRNLWWNRRYFGGPRAWAEVMRTARVIVGAELKRRAKRQAGLVRDVAREFNFRRLLPSLRPVATRPALGWERRRRFLPLTGVE